MDTECLERIIEVQLFYGLETTGVAFHELHGRGIHLCFGHHLAKSVGVECPVNDVESALAEL